MAVGDIMLKVGGKPFRCHCGANVFHHPEDRPDVYECNGCEEWYVSDEKESDDA